jgi:carbon-monoxide dehydrogenase small subunit
LSSENSNSETITGKRLLRLRVNGELHEVAGHVTHSLLEVLREEIGLTGTKHGCELGECGTCTVLVDGEPIYSCLMLAVEAEGPEITTVEGLALPGRPHPLQRAFSDLGAAQCGYCIPGILLAAKSLLDKQPDPSRGDIEEGLSGNLCRCTGYTKIIEAVERAVREMQGCRIQGAEGRST